MQSIRKQQQSDTMTASTTVGGAKPPTHKKERLRHGNRKDHNSRGSNHY